MPATLTYPGVYIEEIRSSVHPITGVATSIAAFVGQTPKGPESDPTTVHSFSEFQQTFGGLANQMTLGFAVRDFFLNGGSEAVIVRVVGGGAASGAPAAGTTGTAGTPGGTGTTPAGGTGTGTPPAGGTGTGTGTPPAGGAGTGTPPAGGTGTGTTPAAPVPSAATLSFGADSGKKLVLVAASRGSWGNALSASVDYNTLVPDKATPRTTFNLTVTETRPDGSGGKTERFASVSTDPASARYLPALLLAQSSLVRVASDSAIVVPTVQAPATQVTVTAAGGVDGGPLTDADLLGGPTDTFQADKVGLYALEKADLFNLLCIPPLTFGGTLSPTVVGTAVAYCEQRRAMMLVDPPDSWNKASDAVTGGRDLQGSVGIASETGNAAIFFPRLMQQNPFNHNQVEAFAPCGAIAGVFARTDAQRGVWKAPAGVDAVLKNVLDLSVPLHDGENGDLNQIGVNCLRAFPIIGRVIWGTRTNRGADILADEYKYIPVRRTALFLEESLFRGTKWVVFEPNDEPLWAQIRLNIGAFMHNLFRQGAFQGTTPKDAYFVKCDKETTTQNDIDLGIVNIVVGFAPLKPAEFVVIQLQQMAGSIEV